MDGWAFARKCLMEQSIVVIAGVPNGTLARNRTYAVCSFAKYNCFRKKSSLQQELIFVAERGA